MHPCYHMNLYSPSCNHCLENIASVTISTLSELCKSVQRCQDLEKSCSTEWEMIGKSHLWSWWVGMKNIEVKDGLSSTIPWDHPPCQDHLDQIKHTANKYLLMLLHKSILPIISQALKGMSCPKSLELMTMPLVGEHILSCANYTHAWRSSWCDHIRSWVSWETWGTVLDVRPLCAVS